MLGFTGIYTPRLDDKGRVTLPAKYRDSFAAGVMLSRGQDHCLFVFTPEGFEKFAGPKIDAPITDPVARANQRYLFANTDEQRPDAQGRISITPRMRDYAGLNKDVVILGSGGRMEIWDAASWQEYEALHEPAYAVPEGGFLDT